MQYISTRGGAEPVDFVTACLAGLAPDGGLYIPMAWPEVPQGPAGEPYIQQAGRILSAFAGSAMSPHDIEAICTVAYDSFSHVGVTPLRQWSSDRWILELHHGPTLAFKDVAMQFIGHFFDTVLGARGQRMRVICATSGDTGGAAAAAFAGRQNVDLFILHPHERISPVQRRFMTTTGASNVYNFALDSDFDACQAIVKALFADTAFVGEVQLSGVNSINWARIAAQSAYFAATASALGRDGPLRFVVPTGNMGDALAGYVARQCGLLPSETEIVCAVNANQALVEIVGDGRFIRQPAKATPSPAMDIATPSNMERLIFDLSGQDSGMVRSLYGTYHQSGSAHLPTHVTAAFANARVRAVSVSDDETLREMKAYYGETGELICPHTAVGTYAARHLPPTAARTIVLSTAHAAKFPETVMAATGKDAPLPARCGDLDNFREDFQRLPADLNTVRTAILRALSSG